MNSATERRQSLRASVLWFGSLALTLCVGKSSLADSFENAVAKNNLDLIETYLDETVDVDYRGVNGKTALMIAAREGKQNLVNRLINHHADINAKNINGGTPLMFAAIHGSPDVVSTLLDAGADVNDTGTNGWGALMVAVAKGHEHATRLLINAGADVNAIDIYLWTPLMRAAAENRISVASLLLKVERININQQDDHGAIALHHAAGNGSKEIVELLLVHGSDPGFTDDLGRTPADYARIKGHSDLASILNSSEPKSYSNHGLNH